MGKNKSLVPTMTEAHGDAGVSPAKTATATVEPQNDGKALGEEEEEEPCGVVLSKNAQKKLAKQQRWEAKKAEKKAAEKEQKRKEVERKRKEWEESLAGLTEEERAKLVESRMSLRKERMEKRNVEKDCRRERLNRAKDEGQNVVVDLEFSHLMNPNEIRSLVQQVMTMK